MQGSTASQTKSCEFKGLRTPDVFPWTTHCGPRNHFKQQKIHGLVTQTASDRSYLHAGMRSTPIYGRSTSGIRIEPSACW